MARRSTPASEVQTPSAGSKTAPREAAAHDAASAHREESLTAKLDRVRPLALALPDALVEPFKADANVVCINAKIAVDALLPHRELLARRLSDSDWTLAFSANDIAEALIVCDERRRAPQNARQRVAQVRQELQGLRAPALMVARALAMLSYLPMEEVQRIEAGSGLLDMARDGIALSHLYRSNAHAIEGMHPFTDARLTRMETLGSWLLRNVQPTTARGRTVHGAAADAALCDRVWTLLTHAHKTLREGAFLVWGDAYAQHVPGLRTYAASSRTASQTPAPAPAPAPTPVPSPA